MSKENKANETKQFSLNKFDLFFSLKRNNCTYPGLLPQIPWFGPGGCYRYLLYLPMIYCYRYLLYVWFNVTSTILGYCCTCDLMSLLPFWGTIKCLFLGLSLTCITIIRLFRLWVERQEGHVVNNSKLISGQSYKASTIVNYDSTVVIWGIFKSGTTLDS